MGLRRTFSPSDGAWETVPWADYWQWKCQGVRTTQRNVTRDYNLPPAWHHPPEPQSSNVQPGDLLKSSTAPNTCLTLIAFTAHPRHYLWNYSLILNNAGREGGRDYWLHFTKKLMLWEKGPVLAIWVFDFEASDGHERGSSHSQPSMNEPHHPRHPHNGNTLLWTTKADQKVLKQEVRLLPPEMTVSGLVYINIHTYVLQVWENVQKYINFSINCIILHAVF